METGNLVPLLPIMSALADVPYRLETFEASLKSIGWQTTRERFEDAGAHGFDCWDKPGPGLFVACFDKGDECTALGIQAVGEWSPEEAITWRDYYVADKGELTRAFEDCLRVAIRHYGQPDAKGMYGVSFKEELFAYAYWVHEYSFLALLIYPETDLSSDPSLDLRIIPRHGSDKLVLPLTSTIIL